MKRGMNIRPILFSVTQILQQWVNLTQVYGRFSTNISPVTIAERGEQTYRLSPSASVALKARQSLFGASKWRERLTCSSSDLVKQATFGTPNKSAGYHRQHRNCTRHWFNSEVFQMRLFRHATSYCRN
jgi:hypothetical protein